MSPGGRSITVLRSRTPRGLPRIVNALADGTVTTARSDIDTVVTEWGVARLAHLTISERVRALIAIAHPEDRATLTREHS
jgi:acyl-CoA hydrolase